MVWSMFGYQEGEETAAGPETQGKPIKDRADEDTTSKSMVEEAFECDYEKSCTPLYSKIEAAVSDADWHPIVKFLDTGYWPGSLFVDTLPPAEQVRTWVTRFDPDDPTMVKWSQLPLHLAIVCNAPFKVIGRIVELYPQAVRCTDDQHMLPLHLALRHNASDEIVAYFLMQFPEAVNAKGKDNRTPIDCAMRAKDKLRGKILQIFVTKTKAKNVLSAASNKEIGLLQASLNNKITQLEEAQTKIIDLQAAEDKIEQMDAAMKQREADLIAKIGQLEKDKLVIQADATKKLKDIEDEKLVQDVEYQKTIDALKKEKNIVEEARRVACAEEKNIRKELDEVEQRLNDANTPDAYESLKEDVSVNVKNRLEQTKSVAADEIDHLRKDLERNLMESQGKTDANLRSMQKMVEELRAADISARTATELNTLREEVDGLRKELKDREEASKIKLDLDALKQAMEKELRKEEGKTKEELTMLKKVVEGMGAGKLDQKTTEELSALKHELEELKKELKENELANKAKQDVDELRTTLEQALSQARGDTKQELAAMKAHVESIHGDIDSSKSKDEMVSIKRELEAVKIELRNNELAIQTKNEVEELRKTLEKEIEASRGQTKTELNSMMKHVQSIEGEMAKKQSAEQVVSLMDDVEKLKEEMKQKEEASQMKIEMVVMKKALELEIRNSEGKTKDELAQLKRAVHSADEKKLDSKNLSELSTIKNELEELKDALKKKEEAEIARTELEFLKHTVDKMMYAWEGDARTQLKSIKKSIASLYGEQIETKGSDEWEEMQAEISTIRKDVRGAEAALKVKRELEALKTSLESELKTADDKSEEELSAMKKAIDAIDFEHVDIKNQAEWDAIRKELTALKVELKEKEYGEVVLKKELEELRMSQDGFSVGSGSINMKKEKKGIRKLFTRWRKKSKKTKDNDDQQENEEDEPKPETILPPSVANTPSQPPKTSDTASQSTNEEAQPAAQIETPADEEREETSSKASKKSSKSESAENLKPYEMVQTVSKLMNENGDIEMTSGPETEEMEQPITVNDE